MRLPVLHLSNTSRWLIAGGLFLVSAGALAYQFGFSPFSAAETPQLALTPPITLTPSVAVVDMVKKHAEPDQVLARTLEHLHGEALQHFYSDPRNGYFRMPPVYEKIVKEWKMPWFSPGEIQDEKGAKPHPDLAAIHATSTGHFFDPRPSPRIGGNVPTLIYTKNAAKWNEINRDKKHWEAKNIDLIGLIYGPEPVAYVSEKLADMDKTGEVPTRALDDFEVLGLTALGKGEEIFSRSRDGVVRMLGAVRANASCIACHEDKKEGDLLGAFSYTLREAEYVRKSPRFGAAQP